MQKGALWLASVVEIINFYDIWSFLTLKYLFIVQGTSCISMYIIRLVVAGPSQSVAKFEELATVESAQFNARILSFTPERLNDFRIALRRIMTSCLWLIYRYEIQITGGGRIVVTNIHMTRRMK
jgi:hypothetical protein